MRSAPSARSPNNELEQSSKERCQPTCLSETVRILLPLRSVIWFQRARPLPKVQGVGILRFSLRSKCVSIEGILMKSRLKSIRTNFPHSAYRCRAGVDRTRLPRWHLARSNAGWLRNSHHFLARWTSDLTRQKDQLVIGGPPTRARRLRCFSPCASAP